MKIKIFVILINKKYNIEKYITILIYILNYYYNHI